MLAKLVWNAGVAAVAIGATLAVLASTTANVGISHNPYTLTVSKNASNHFVIADKPQTTPPFKLDYYGVVSFKITNGTDGPINLMMHEFRRGPGGGCPLDFLMNGDTAQCIGRATLPRPGDFDVIFATRGDTNPKQSERYSFNIRVNGQIVDPEIEIERDPVRVFDFLKWLLAAGGLMAMLAGWWLGRQR